MTETLTRILHDRADGARLDPVDLDAVTRAGVRVVRRRRLGAAAAVLAVGIVGMVGVTGLGGADRRSADVTSPPVSTNATVTWVTGTHLHAASNLRDGWSSTFNVDLGHPISAYVRTAEGYVVTDGQHIWSYVDGKVSQVDTVEGSFPSSTFRMVGDTDGSLAAWPSRHGPVVLDQATGKLTRIPETTQLQVISVDGRSVYLGAQGHAIAIDVDTQQATLVDKFNNDADGNDASLIAAQDGTYLGYDLKGDPVARTRADVWMTLSFDQRSALTLSPDGDRAVVGDVMTPGPVSAYDLRDGSQGAVPPTDSYLAYPYEWLDDDTVVMLSLATEDADYRLITCTMSELSCEVAVPDLGEGRDSGPSNGVGFVLPIGEEYFPFPHG
jgi:hypothetical protein